jgi:subtilisin
VSGLSSGTDYEFRAAADASDGDTDTGTTATFTTDSEDSSDPEYPNDLKIDGSDIGHKVSYEITVSEDIAKGDKANDNDTIDGSTADGQVNGGIDTYDFSGEVTDVWTSDDVPIYVDGTLVDPGESTGSAPDIDRYEVIEANSPNPDANIIAEWDVSDADGDLAAGRVEVIGASGTVVASAETGIDGNVYYGFDYFEIADVDGETFDVKVTVTDANGRQTTATETVSE